MSADSFHVCYGIRWDLDGTDDEEIRLLEKHEDSRMQAAHRHGLQHWWGQTEKKGQYFLLVGRILTFGGENENAAHLSDAQIAQIMAATKQKLQEAGFSATPALYCQFEPDY